MTRRMQTCAVDTFEEHLAEQVFDGQADVLRLLLDEVVRLNRVAVIKAAPQPKGDDPTAGS